LAKKSSAPKNSRPILVYLRAIRASLKRTERRIADYILEDPDRVLSTPISQLREGCKASVGSIVAFCKRLNTQGYADFKLVLAGELASSGLVVDLRAPEAYGRSIYEQVFRSHMLSLTETFSLNEEATLAAVARAIRRARRIEVFSIGMSFPIAYTASCKLGLIGIPANATSDSHLQLVAATHMKRGDLAIGVSCSGRTRETVQCLEVARSHQATTVCLTNSIKSPLTRAADIVLCATPSEVKFFQAPLASRITQLALIDALVVILAHQSRRRTTTLLRQSTEKLMQRRIS
jgi:RpiR family carbohydrate utilization transcriptional regulator